MSLAIGDRQDHCACSEASPSEFADERLIGRRKSTRHALQLSGRFVAGDINVRVWIEDISATGAAIRLMAPRPLAPGRLAWLGFEQFADIAWQHEARGGLRFADPLSADCLRRTLEAGELAAKGDPRVHQLAAAWTHGPGDY